jgi:hypothetical protein
MYQNVELVIKCKTVFPLIATALHTSQDVTKKIAKGVDELIMYNFLKRTRTRSSHTCLLIFFWSIIIHSNYFGVVFI